jgi:hypothetical protein
VIARPDLSDGAFFDFVEAPGEMPGVVGVAARRRRRIRSSSAPARAARPPCFLYGYMSPTQVEQILQVSANDQPCPEPKTVVQGPGFTFATATCQGASGTVGAGYDNFFGKGIVDALKAVTR